MPQDMSLMVGLKKVYRDHTEETILLGLDSFEEKWEKKYPKIAVSRRSN